MATIITEKFYIKQNGKYDKETIILEEDYPIDEELVNLETDKQDLSSRSIACANKKAALEAKKAAAATKKI